MFKKVGCPNCYKNYDDALEKCPFCGENNEYCKQTKGSQASFLAFWKQILLVFVGSLGFQILGLILQLIVLGYGKARFGYTGDELAQFASGPWAIVFIDGLAYFLLFTALVLVCFKDSIGLLKKFKGWKPYVVGGITFGTIIMFDVTYNMILNLFQVESSSNANQSVLTSAITVAPIICLLMFGIIGPICEELTYRVGLFSFFRRINKYLAYAITILVFALIHFDFECFSKGTWLNELINLPFYMFAGFAFTFAYEKFGFAASVSAHISNNIYSILATIILSKIPA